MDNYNISNEGGTRAPRGRYKGGNTPHTKKTRMATFMNTNCHELSI